MKNKKLDTLKDRYFVRLGEQTDIHDLPLTSKRILIRILIHFLMGDYHSIQIYREDYMDKKVFNNERKNGVLVRGEGVTMRSKITNKNCYDPFISQFREGLYDPEKNGIYIGESMNISPFTSEQFEDSVALLTLIHEGNL